MFERFTDRARRVIVLAQEEARTLNHNYIGTEHLLLGLIAEGEGVATQALESLGVSLEGLRAKTEELIGRGQISPSGHIPFTPRAKRVMELSLREALQLGHNWIGTEHILLALIRIGEGGAADLLTGTGIELARTRHAVIKILTITPSDTQKAEPVSKPQPNADYWRGWNDVLALLKQETQPADRLKLLQDNGCKPVRITPEGKIFIGDDEFLHPVETGSVHLERMTAPDGQAFKGRHNLLTLTLLVGDVTFETKPRPTA